MYNRILSYPSPLPKTIPDEESLVKKTLRILSVHHIQAVSEKEEGNRPEFWIFI
jgi:hypothetical protein